MATARSVAAVTGNIAWASLDPGLHALMLDESSRTALREELLVVWFGSRQEALQSVIEDERGIDRYQTQLRDSAAGSYRVPQETGRRSPRGARIGPVCRKHRCS